MKFNACCYADDVLICSITITGLRTLIEMLTLLAMALGSAHLNLYA